MQRAGNVNIDALGQQALHNFRKQLDQNVAFASEGRELALTDNVNDEDTEIVVDSDG